MRLIGIAGTNGSGKDTVGQILADDYNFMFISVTDLLRAECRVRGIEVKRENLRMISAEWRRDGGLGVLVDKALQTYNEATEKYAGLVMASLRNPGEADRIHQLGGKMLWVDADPELRYERVSAGNRGRGGEDDKTYEQFLAEEAAEMEPPKGADAATLNMSAVRDLADATLLNETTLGDLQQAVVAKLAP